MLKPKHTYAHKRTYMGLHTHRIIHQPNKMHFILSLKSEMLFIVITTSQFKIYLGININNTLYGSCRRPRHHH